MTKEAEKANENKTTTDNPEKTANEHEVVSTPSITTVVAPTEMVAVVNYNPIDVENNKVWAVVSYLGVVGIIIVLLTEGKNSPYAKFHLNQSILLTIAFTIGGLMSIIPIIGWYLIGPIVQIAWMILWIIGVINAAQGRIKRLPVVGDYDLIT